MLPASPGVLTCDIPADDLEGVDGAGGLVEVAASTFLGRLDADGEGVSRGTSLTWLVGIGRFFDAWDCEGGSMLPDLSFLPGSAISRWIPLPSFLENLSVTMNRSLSGLLAVLFLIGFMDSFTGSGDGRSYSLGDAFFRRRSSASMIGGSVGDNNGGMG